MMKIDRLRTDMGHVLVSRHAVLLLFFLLTMAHFSAAQLQRYPLKRAGMSLPPVKRDSDPRARTKEEVPLALPFWDDFAKSYGPYPDTLRWENSSSVWVNNGTAIDPPTINVATLDGLNENGVAYSANEILLTGFTDTLTSKKIDISENMLPAAERNTVFLSFFYQWRGNGEAPDPQDYLLVEFKDSKNQWEPALTIKPQGTFTPDIFYTAIVRIDSNKFFHDKFQFRIKAYGRQSGPYDTWNIDYVYLNKGRNSNDTAFPDQAITSPLTNLFKNQYRSVPYRHFIHDLSLLRPEFNIYNLRGNPPEVLTYFTEGTFKNYIDGDTVIHFVSNLGGSNISNINDGSGLIFPFEKRTVTLEYIPNVNDKAQFNPDADYIDIDLKVKLITGDNIDPKTGLPSDDYNPDYFPIDFRINDTTRSSYSLRDYYAYDDGVAEYAAGLIRAGDLIAYEFELPFNDTFKQDTLVAFDIYLPPYGMTSNQTIDFFIYGDANGEPNDATPLLGISGRPVSRKGINEFQRISFLPALLIDKPKFYIGWKQPAAGKMLVGLDMSNDTGSKVFVNVNGTWERNNRVHGSLMVRPIFGKGLVDVTIGTEEEALQFSVFPNPSRGSFYIEGPVDHLDILSATGQKVPFDTVHEQERMLIQLHQPSGLYLLRCTKGTVTKTHKIILTR